MPPRDVAPARFRLCDALRRAAEAQPRQRQDPQVPLRHLVVGHGDGGPALQARHHHLQQEARAALLNPREHQVSKRAKAQQVPDLRSGLMATECGSTMQ